MWIRDDDDESIWLDEICVNCGHFYGKREETGPCDVDAQLTIKNWNDSCPKWNLYGINSE